MLLEFLLLPVLNTDLLSLFLISVRKVCLESTWYVARSTEDARKILVEDESMRIYGQDYC